MKVSIITRAFNRLEYTIQCINGVLYNSGYEDYEHIIVNQGSSDGTKEWLQWIKKIPNKWYEKVVPINLKRNTGDFGGMKIGFKKSSGDLIMQLDNDVYMCTKNWLDKMVTVIEEISSETLMANRKGYRKQIKPIDNNFKKVLYNNEILECVKIPHAVSCYITKRHIFEEKYKKAKRCRHLTAGQNCWKVNEVYGCHIEGYDPENGSYIQQEKYGFQVKKQFLSKKFIFKTGIRK